MQPLEDDLVALVLPSTDLIRLSGTFPGHRGMTARAVRSRLDTFLRAQVGRWSPDCGSGERPVSLPRFGGVVTDPAAGESHGLECGLDLALIFGPLEPLAEGAQ